MSSATRAERIADAPFGGAAFLDREHGMSLCRRQRRAMLITESRATKPALQTGTRSGKVGEPVSRDSSGLAVAQTVLVEIMRYCAVVLRFRWPSNNWMVRRSVPASSR